MAAIGTVTAYAGAIRVSEIVLLASRNSTNGKPSGSSAGLAIQDIINIYNWRPDIATLRIYSSAISGVGSVAARLWGYSPAAGWAPVGFGADDAKGLLNNGAAIGESDTDAILHAEPIALPMHFQRLYLELTSLANATLEASLVISPPV